MDQTSKRTRILAALVALLGLGLGVLVLGFPGTRPDNLGATEGRLAAVPSSPNCVSSQADPSDATHYVAPIAYSGPSEVARERLLAALEKLALKLITAEDHYVYAEATSSLLGFVDDVEFLFPAEGEVIHCRSASRLGHSDFGVNRKRIEAVRTALAEIAPVGS